MEGNICLCIGTRFWYWAVHADASLLVHAYDLHDIVHNFLAKGALVGCIFVITLEDLLGRLVYPECLPTKMLLVKLKQIFP